ncbi:MAG: hypothetical protein HYU99_00650 [Deltaproteobacteria bacterium]|nr:hypothetical protein [Deltaproteobacteria bacterium]
MGGLSIENNNDLFGIGAEALRGGVSAASSGLKLLQSMDGKEIKALNDAEIVKLPHPPTKSTNR